MLAAAEFPFGNDQSPYSGRCTSATSTVPFPEIATAPRQQPGSLAVISVHRGSSHFGVALLRPGNNRDPGWDRGQADLLGEFAATHAAMFSPWPGAPGGAGHPGRCESGRARNIALYVA